MRLDILFLECFRNNKKHHIGLPFWVTANGYGKIEKGTKGIVIAIDWEKGEYTIKNPTNQMTEVFLISGGNATAFTVDEFTVDFSHLDGIQQDSCKICGRSLPVLNGTLLPCSGDGKNHEEYREWLKINIR